MPILSEFIAFTQGAPTLFGFSYNIYPRIYVDWTSKGNDDLISHLFKSLQSALYALT